MIEKIKGTFCDVFKISFIFTSIKIKYNILIRLLTHIELTILNKGVRPTFKEDVGPLNCISVKLFAMMGREKKFNDKNF